MIFLGREISEQRDYSEEVAREIDKEVRGLVGEAYEQARSIVNQYRDKLDTVAQRLLEVETITREEFEEMFPTPVVKNSGTPIPQPAVPQMA